MFQGGWADYLARRGMAFIPDSLGRDSVTHSHAKQLLDERRELVLRQRAAARVAEQLAVEDDQLRRKQIWGGIPVDRLPVGMSPTEAMVAAGEADRPRRRDVVASILDGDGMTYQPYEREAS